MDRRILKTKKAIRTAFSSLIKDRDIDQITITELTNEADIDRRTFYFHYNTIMDIVLEIENEVIQELDQKFSQNSEFHLLDFFNCLNSIVIGNFDLFKCITQTNNYRLQKECSKILYNTLSNVFYEKSKLDKIRFDYYCEYVTAGIMAVYIKWLSSENRSDISTLCELATHAVSEGWKKISGSDL